MISLIGKPIDAISVEDVRQLIREKYPEDGTMEFKESLPAGGTDAWLHKSQIFKPARDKILAEVIGFANAHGGHVILGIKETRKKPARAARIAPIPRCVELAERLRLQARDCIDPQLPVFDTWGVKTRKDGSGVVVIRCPESRLAPHRLKETRESHIRRGDRCETLTMREIQDLTLQRERGLSLINKRFDEFRDRLYDTLSKMETSAMGMRFTLVPLSTQLWIPRVHNNPAVRPSHTMPTMRAGSRDVTLVLPAFGWDSSPILRGTRFFEDYQKLTLFREVYCDGCVEFRLVEKISEERNDYVKPEWLLGFAANAVITAHRTRVCAGVPDAEYGFEVEIVRHGGSTFRLSQFGATPEHYWKLENPLLFPRYSVGSTEEFTTLIEMINRDLWDSAGLDSKEEFAMTFPQGSF